LKFADEMAPMKDLLGMGSQTRIADLANITSESFPFNPLPKKYFPRYLIARRTSHPHPAGISINGI
jgi:hypothetical protein